MVLLRFDLQSIPANVGWSYVELTLSAILVSQALSIWDDLTAKERVLFRACFWSW